MCTSGAAGFRAMHIFSSTYFDEIIIFELSKDQTFRIWSTFMNPEQFLILVLYLLISHKKINPRLGSCKIDFDIKKKILYFSRGMEMSAKSPENVWYSNIFDKFSLNFVFDFCLAQSKTIYKTIFLIHILLPFVFSRIFEKNC